MDNLTQYVVVTFCIGLTLALFSTLEPWVDELSSEDKRTEKAKLNAELCPGTEYKIIDEVTYCDYQGTLVKPKDYEKLIK